MKKREWLLVLLPLVLTIAVDQITKQMALGLNGTKMFGFFGLALHFNKGAMLGMFSDLPPILRIVSLSTGGAFLLFTYVIIQYLLPIRSLLLRAGMSILMGGIIGNVIDRTVAGHVIDFAFFEINFSMLGGSLWHSPVFNIADVLQWVGYGCLVTALLKDGDILWPENNLRKYYWINPSYQLKYCLTLVMIGSGFALMAGVFCYTFIRFMMVELVGNNQRLLDQFLVPFIQTFSIFTVAFGAFLFMIGKILSHRVAGPLFAFERFLKDHIKGKKARLRLRKGDEFLHLEQLALLVIDNLGPRQELNEPVPLLPVGQQNLALNKPVLSSVQVS